VTGAFSGLSELFAFLLFFGVPLTALMSAILTPPSVFRAAKSSKALWIVLPILFGFIAGGIYWLFVQPRLKRARRL
jgi:hypothetical protein